MRKLFVLILVVGLLGLGSIANAAATFDFSSFTTPQDLTTGAFNTQGVTFRYFGGANAALDTAGVTGDPAGYLQLLFATTVTNLSLGFNFLDASGVVTNRGTLDAIFEPSLDSFFSVPTAGGLTYGGLFDTVTLYFNPDGSDPFFRVGSIQYDTVTAVPEPSTMMLLTAGLFGLGMLRRVRRNA